MKNKHHRLQSFISQHVGLDLIADPDLVSVAAMTDGAELLYLQHLRHETFIVVVEEKREGSALRLDHQQLLLLINTVLLPLGRLPPGDASETGLALSFSDDSSHMLWFSNTRHSTHSLVHITA